MEPMTQEDRRAFLRRFLPPPGMSAPESPALAVAPALDPAAPAVTAGPLAPLGIEAGLEPYAAPLDARRAAHLLRRACFGAAPERTADFTGRTAEEVVDGLVDEALARPLPEPPSWADTPPPPRGSSDEAFQDYFNDNAEWLAAYRAEWFAEMRTGGLRERMTLFWHDHFVTATQTYALAPFAHRYLTLLRTHALGDFRQFVYDIGIDPAMLVYLNGNVNAVGAPNENYARELLELFTMGQYDHLGQENYTQEDIQEIARALTGWVVDYFSLQVYFLFFLHDGAEKTVMGRTGAFGYDDVVDILFEERAEAIAHFICRKLYEEFVYAAPDEALVGELAAVFLENDFQIAPVMRALLKSAHFFDEQVIGARVKSPAELMTGLLIESENEPSEAIRELMPRAGFFMGQWVLDPPNVAGWPGHHDWLTTTTLPIRWLVQDVMLYGDGGAQPLDLTTLAAEVYDAADPYAGLYLPTALAEHLLPVPVETLDIGEVDGAFVGNLDANPIPDDVLDTPHIKNLAMVFLAGIPWYEWTLASDDANNRLLGFVRYLLQFPEFHLM